MLIATKKKFMVEGGGFVSMGFELGTSLVGQLPNVRRQKELCGQLSKHVLCL
jgi:hypothetical protein